MKIYNTLTRTKEELVPIDKNEIKKILANRETKMADIALGSIDENKQLTITTY